MTVSYVKVFPNKKNELIFETSKKIKEPSLCPCKILRMAFLLNRFTFNFPFTWKHVNGRCTFKLSTPWRIYYLIGTIVLSVWASFVMPSIKLDVTNLPLFLDSVTNLLSMIFVCVSSLYMINRRVWIDFIKRLDYLNKAHLFCFKSKNNIRKYHRFFLAILLGLSVLQNLTFIYFKLFVTPELPYHVLFFRNLQVLPQFSFQIWFMCLRYIQSQLTCFENVIVNYLNYRPIHPHKEIKITQNDYKIGGISTGMSICDEKHYLPLHLSNLSKPEIIEYLRIKHQRIYEEIHLLLKISSPQLLAYLLIEVLIQILHLYSIIVHIIYKFDNPTAGSTIILNCISIVWHGNGVYYLCWNMNILNEMVERLRRILTLCKFTTEDAEEHRQFRIFINKLGHQKSILINDYFEIDLGIIGPVVGNILTYVLVALQFKIPPQKTN